MNDAITYLYNRITETAEIRAQSPRANISAGCRVILDIYGTQFPTRDDCDFMLDIAYGNVQKRLRSKSGPCMLTATSSGIGRVFRKEANHLPLEDPVEDWKLNISIGDLILEALNNTGYIEIKSQFVSTDTPNLTPYFYENLEIKQFSSYNEMAKYCLAQSKLQPKWVEDELTKRLAARETNAKSLAF